jgi:hypothetical protein
MRDRRKFILMLMLGLATTAVMAQETASQGGDGKGGFMRSEGKIYVVVAIALTILAGLFIYIARLDKKISRLEKGNHD